MANKLTWGEYVKYKNIKASLPSINGLYCYEGKTYTLKQIKALFPTNGRLVNANDRTALKGENSDKTKNFIHDEKSY